VQGLGTHAVAIFKKIRSRSPLQQIGYRSFMTKILEEVVLGVLAASLHDSI